MITYLGEANLNVSRVRRGQKMRASPWNTEGSKAKQRCNPGMGLALMLTHT